MCGFVCVTLCIAHVPTSVDSAPCVRVIVGGLEFVLSPVPRACVTGFAWFVFVVKCMHPGREFGAGAAAP